MSADEKKAALQNQVQTNLREMLNAVLEEYPKETAELLCLCCFIDPADMEKHSMTELFGAINEILGNAEIISFFASLARLGLTSGSDSARA